MILNSVQNGPLIWPTVVEEDSTTRIKRYEELSVEEKLQVDCDLKATNIVLQCLPPDVYAIVNHHKVAKEIWDRVKLLMQDLGIPNGQTAQTTIPNTVAFQIEDLDAYDSDCNDVSNAKAVLMANLSNYGSDVISKVPHFEPYHTDMDNQSMFKLDLDPLAPRLLKNQGTHIDYLKFTQDQADILRGIVKQAKAKQPLDNPLDFACKHAKRIQELLISVRDTCPDTYKPSKNLVAVTPMNKVKKVRCSKHVIGNRSQLMNFVSKFLRTVGFRNDQIEKIMRYGIPKLKFKKDHLCLACALGKSKKSSHQPKAEDTNQEKIYLLHLDLCGLMRVESINGKKYILVIVDDYSRFTWVKFLRSKDDAPDAIIKRIKNIQVHLNATVHNVRTDNGTKFVN
nr:ribonuclease H-like domain-containing protein [Tanacetum cinerariifolium]